MLRCQTFDVKYTEIADELLANAAPLNVAVSTVTQMPARSKFLTYGCLMACMAQVDLISKCEYGKGEPEGGQSERMRSFMERYLGAQKIEEHRVAVQLMRHTLMHTGELRYLYEKKTETAYTWRIHFADTFPAGKFGHYTLNVGDPNYQDHLLDAVDGNVTTIKAFNLNITQFATDMQQVAHTYTTAMNNDPTLQTKCQAYPEIRVQPLKSPKP